MIIKLLGWACTTLVVAGFLLNSNKRYRLAISLWMVGDVGWIIYDYNINNWSHAALSGTIISINIYGWYKHSKKKILADRRRRIADEKLKKIADDLFIG